MKKIMFVVLFLLGACGDKEVTEPITEVEMELSGTKEVDRVFVYGEMLTIETDLPGVFEIGDLRFDTKLGEVIDDRIPLYAFEEGVYPIYLVSDGAYYGICHPTFESIDFYTVQRDGVRKHIQIESDTHTMTMTVEEVNELPEDVYDLVVNPGHGGSDVGASSPFIGETEKFWVLQLSQLMTKEFEALGYKVFLTRVDDEVPGGESLDRIPADPYVTGGRIDLIYESNGKYVFSNHLNSFGQTNGREGVEIYSSVHTSNALSEVVLEALLEAGGVVSNHGTSYRVSEGIYKRPYSQADIEATTNELNGYGVSMYEAFDEAFLVDRYWEIRETGGIGLFAFSDGRHPKYEANNHLASNVGLETLVIEYGYLNNESDANRFEEYMTDYAKSVVKSVDELLQGGKADE